MRTAVAIAIFLASTSASANSSPPPASVGDGPKTPVLATLISFGATAAPSALGYAILGDDGSGGQFSDGLVLTIGASVLIGPSAGHWYAGKLVTSGLIVRALGFLALSGAISAGGDTEHGIGLLFVGGGLLVGGGVYDLATADRSAREYNFAHATKLMLAPRVGDGQLGLGLTGSF